MKKYLGIITFAILFLFLIQMTGILVESIYILDLLNTSLDAKALGLLFFFTPILLLFFRKSTPGWVLWFLLSILIISRGITPYLDTTGRMLSSGTGVGAALLLLPLLINFKPKEESNPHPGLYPSLGLGLAVGLSIFLRTVNFTIDYSLTTAGSWIGWGLGLIFGWVLIQVERDTTPETSKSSKGITLSVYGLIMVFALVYFVFSAPGVIARWTEGNYALIVISTSLLTLSWVFASMIKPGFLNRISRPALIVWNLLFTLALVGTILAQRIAFPLTPDAAPVVVGSPTWIQQLPLIFMLILFPVVFIDMFVFVRNIQNAHPVPRSFAPGLLLGTFSLVLLVFINIFTNVWGYVEPVSLIFRNKYWLPFGLIAGTLTLLVIFLKRNEAHPEQAPAGNFQWGWKVILAILFLGTGIAALRTDLHHPSPTGKTSLLVMTYNIQEGNDGSAEKSYLRQLVLIQQVSPDILFLQETDSARISLNNSDYVRYYASKLGYYSYYGPTTVSGTFGTAILSKYPLLNTRSVFTFSDTDEIGTAEAEIEVDGRTFNLYDVHPDGSNTAKLVFARKLLARSQDKTNVIAAGDYNLRAGDEAYQLIAAVYKNAWISIYPSGISDSGVDMSGRNRIDHIFLSNNLSARNPVYVLPPESATDHPVHWAEVFWAK